MGSLVGRRRGYSRAAGAFSMAEPVLASSVLRSDCNSRGWHFSTLVILGKTTFIHVAALPVRRDSARIRDCAAISLWAVRLSSTFGSRRAKP